MNTGRYWLFGGALTALAGAYYLLRENVSMRTRAVRLLEKAVPADIGDPIFSEVARDYGGMGTTCGYLASWLLYSLGKTEHVNRTSERTSYRIGANIAAVRQNPAFVLWRPGLRPSPGDIVFLSDGPPDTEHVAGVMRWNDGWNGILTADYGQRGPKGQAGRFVLRNWDPATGKVTRPDIGLTRQLVGWVDIEKAR